MSNTEVVHVTNCMVCYLDITKEDVEYCPTCGKIYCTEKCMINDDHTRCQDIDDIVEPYFKIKPQ